MLLNHQRGYLFADQNVPLVGSATRERGRLNQTSPLDRVDKIRVPVFLAHGEDDDRVDVAHTLKMAKALKKAGKKHELLIIKDEAHSLRDEAMRIELYSRLGAFLIENTRVAPRPQARPGHR